MRSSMLLIAIVAACGPTAKAKPDAAVRVDAPRDTSDPLDDLVPDMALEEHDSNLPYVHTIAIDGSDDFAARDQLETTSSPAYGARVSWDATNLYVGYRGPDLETTATDAANKWLFVYIDKDPGTANGATESVLYRTQKAAFPTGFRADVHARWKADGTFHDTQTFDTAWTATTDATWGHAGDFVEVAIPRALLGPGPIGLVTWMINEADLHESSYAGLFAGNFTDGYAATLALTKYERIDFASPLAPNDPSNVAP